MSKKTIPKYMTRLVLPNLAGKLDGTAIRVPTANVSIIDLTIISKKKISIKEIIDKVFKIIIAYLFFIAIFLELTHLFIPERGFETKDLGGNIVGVTISLIIFLIIKFRKKNELF